MSRGPSMMFALTLGAGLGLVVGAPAAFLVARAISQSTVEQWKLEPVVVAAVDLEPGMTVTLEHVSQRSIPAQFVNRASVRPNDATRIKDVRAQTLITTGTPLSWWMLSKAPVDGATRSCAELVRASAPDGGSPALRKLVEALETQRTTP